MADELDVYQPCPCGSGKKVKFCCLPILGEMLRAIDLQQHGQWQLALQAFEALEKKPIKEASSRAWVKTQKAMLLLSHGQLPEARQAIAEVLAESPDHPTALLVEATLRLDAEGYPAAMRPIYKGFMACNEMCAELASHLAIMLASVLGAQGHLLAATEHLGLAVRFDSENEKAFEALTRLEQDARAPFPLRVHFPLSAFAGDEKARAHDETARRLVVRGCFSDAAKAFGQIARQNPNDGKIWWNIALCHAWAAEDKLAVQAFKAAAANQSDIESAAECLLLARLLSQPEGANRVERVAQSFRVASVSRLLTELDRQPRFVRLSIPPEALEGGGAPAAMYLVLDRDAAAGRPEELTVDAVPAVTGQLAIFDADPAADKTARAGISCIGRERLAEATRLVTSASSEIEAVDDPRVLGVLAAETVALLFEGHVPEGTPPAVADRLEQERWRRIVDEVWPNTPQESLDGRTPAQAAGAPGMQSALVAAVLALEVFAESHSYSIDPAAIRARLGLPAPLPFEIPPDDEPLRHSVLQIRRLALEPLTDGQLVRAIKAFIRLHMAAHAERGMQVLLTRPALAEIPDLPDLYLALAHLAHGRYDESRALDWMTRAKEAARARRASLDSLLLLEFEELAVRMRNPEDPKLAELAGTLWNYYRPKLPEAAPTIAAILNRVGLPGPWNAPADAAAVPTLEAAGVGSSGLWTPEAQAPAGEPSKLWLPGQ